MQVFVRRLTGYTISVDIEPFNTIKELKAKIQEKTDIPIWQQRLIYSQQQLDNEKTLDYYNINNENVIHIVLKFRSD